MTSCKEWLNTKTREYKQAACVPCGADWVEIPEGMNCAYSEGSFIQFTKQEMGYRDPVLLWQRATQPEELPFIDDEPRSLNDQYAEIEMVRQHKHYFKDVSGLNEIDVYMVLKLFNVTDPCLQHIAKKALCAGRRGHKDFKKDLQDILDTAKRAVEINNEN